MAEKLGWERGLGDGFEFTIKGGLSYGVNYALHETLGVPLIPAELYMIGAIGSGGIYNVLKYYYTEMIKQINLED